MDLAQLEQKVAALEKKVQKLDDIEAIKKLQRAYGYYLEHWMGEDIVDCFADDPNVTLHVAAGVYVGKDHLRRFFRHGKYETPLPYEKRSEFLHQVMQLSGIVDVADDGKTAKGRWYGFGANAFFTDSGKINPGWMNGVYNVEYVKENGVWKLMKVRWCMTFHAPWGMSFVADDRREDQRDDHPYEKAGPMGMNPVSRPETTLYPSGFIAPFHFNHPVTGQKHKGEVAKDQDRK
jgi:hypothetical protein